MHARTAVKDGTFLAVQRDGVLVVPPASSTATSRSSTSCRCCGCCATPKYSDEEAWRWLTTPDESLPGSPFDALHENRATEVKRRAQALGF